MRTPFRRRATPTPAERDRWDNYTSAGYSARNELEGAAERAIPSAVRKRLAELAMEADEFLSNLYRLVERARGLDKARTRIVDSGAATRVDLQGDGDGPALAAAALEDAEAATHRLDDELNDLEARILAMASRLALAAAEAVQIVLPPDPTKQQERSPGIQEIERHLDAVRQALHGVVEVK